MFIRLDLILDITWFLFQCLPLLAYLTYKIYQACVFFWYKTKLEVKRARDKVKFIKGLPFISTKSQVNGLLTSHLARPISGYQS